VVKNMKTLKFAPNLVPLLLSGEKTTTWRLFDDKDLSVGDKILFLNKKTLEEVGVGEIASVEVKTLGTLTDKDWEGHERYSSDEEMYKTYRGYYGDKVGPDSEVKLIDFDFKKD
tara:strand:+ start:12440 stop:12781 length:342 start_codon:yes stop_codon:yes gene_type:complete